MPDGDSRYSIPMEYCVSYTCQPDSNGNLVVVCQPSLPFAGAVVKGVGQLTTPTGGLVTVTAGSGGGPITGMLFPDFINTNYGTGTDYNMNTQRIVNARVIKYDMKVTQITPILNQQGMAVTARVAPFRGENTPQSYDWRSASALYQGATYANLVGVTPTVGYGYNISTVVEATPAFPNIAAYPTKVECNASQSCYMLGAGTDNAWHPVLSNNFTSHDSTTGALRVSGDTVLPVSSMRITDAPTASYGFGCIGADTKWFDIMTLPPNSTDRSLAGLFWLDNTKDVLIWAGKGLASTASFEVQVGLCLELEVNPVGSLYRPLITPPVERDDAAIRVADNVITKLPSSMPMGEGGDWWGSLTSRVTGIGEMLSTLGIPFVSPVAAMASKFTRLFAGA
jgi:hypothetical protein